MKAQEFDVKFESLDKETKRIDATRQSIIKLWLAENWEIHNLP